MWRTDKWTAHLQGKPLLTYFCTALVDLNVMQPIFLCNSRVHRGINNWNSKLSIISSWSSKPESYRLKQSTLPFPSLLPAFTAKKETKKLVLHFLKAPWRLELHSRLLRAADTSCQSFRDCIWSCWRLVLSPFPWPRALRAPAFKRLHLITLKYAKMWRCHTQIIHKIVTLTSDNI